MISQDRTRAAAGFILLYAVVIGFTDNYVRVIADEAGLWQFHLTRSVMALAILAAVAPALGLRLRPVDWQAVAARSAIHGTAMLIYFGALAFLPVAQVAAGLFTAPIFVLVISRFVYGERIGPVRVLAVLTGFAGVLLVLGPEAMAGASFAAGLPVLAGLLYGMGNIATRAWCPQESAGTLLGGFFVALGVLGAAGLAVLALVSPPVPAGPDGFVMRGFVVPSQDFWFWTFVQAAGSLFAVGMMIRAYQAATASRVSVFEYVILPASAIWGWLLWDERLSPVAAAGMALIALAGIAIAMGSRPPAATATPA
ncbi:DMT family transporter [Cereibacter sphaeroides]|uniref:DMT family transporter n=1 Tax=Cereibacter sphaeroides TaxID=1063 RepID=UPI000F538170|nr:DMT family transporter [Cereibacter sphaeroides]AZB63151.1 DMT family transporter [Cereibacter sphaeroides]AZB67047.1 DMT family transporter [Cereibacter sphaeroides]